MLDKWGDVTIDEVEAFVSTLTDLYDLENLRLSGLAIRESLGSDLYAPVSSLTTADTSGPVYFKIAVDQVMYMNSAMIRNLSNQLGSLKLKSIPGENVAILSEKITELAREIVGSGKAPDDLVNLISKPYILGTVDVFKTHALTVYSQVMTGTYMKTWEKLVSKHNAFYRDLVQLDDYPPATGGAADQDAVIQGMICRSIDEKIGRMVPNWQHQSNRNDGGHHNGGRKKRTCCTCFNWGSEDHVIKDCPRKDKPDAKDWRFIPPEDGTVMKWWENVVTTKVAGLLARWHISQANIEVVVPLLTVVKMSHHLHKQTWGRSQLMIRQEEPNLLLTVHMVSLGT